MFPLSLFCFFHLFLRGTWRPSPSRCWLFRAPLPPSPVLSRVDLQIPSSSHNSEVFFSTLLRFRFLSSLLFSTHETRTFSFFKRRHFLLCPPGSSFLGVLRFSKALRGFFLKDGPSFVPFHESIPFSHDPRFLRLVFELHSCS